MSKRYQVLAAMLALRTFTADELAHHTGVKPNTVSTILNRDRSLLEQIGWEDTGRRGGQPKRYNLRADQVSAIETEIRTLYKDLRIPESVAASESAVEIPLGLQVAEEILSKDYPRAKSVAEKQRLLDRARVEKEGGLGEVRVMMAGLSKPDDRAVLETSIGKLEALEELRKAQLVAQKLTAPTAGKAKTAAVGAHGSVPAGISELNEHILKAVNSLDQVHTIPRLTVMQLSPNETEQNIFLIDGIDVEPDELTNHIHNILTSQHISARLVSTKNVFEQTGALSHSPPAFSKCLLTIDSRHNSKRSKEACEHVLDWCNTNESVYVLDMASNDMLRNWILEGRANYFNYAKKLQPAAMLSALKLH